MGGYVNRDDGGWTELRVHGVSGTAPESLLEHPHAVRVAGNEQAGFYRRRWESQATSSDTPKERLEAYSWGGLTAGSGQRALWLLLTPFMLVNVAFWAVPYTGQHDRGIRRAVRRTAEAIQRLFALSITLTLVLAFVSISMNFVGWQCARPFDTCAAKYTWLRFLSWTWLDLPGRRLAVTAVVPLAVIGLLWWLANKSWSQTEIADMPYAKPTEQDTPLESRRMWNGTGPVRRLRAVHIAVSFALVAVLMLAPFAGQEGRVSGRGPAVLFVVALALLVITVVLAFLPSMSDRDFPRDEQYIRRVDLYGLLPWLALGLDVAAGVVLWLQTAGPADLASGDRRTPLPSFSGVVHVLGVAQLASWLAMLLLLLAMRRFTSASAQAPPAANGATAVTTPPAWHGLATVALMLLGSALASAFAAGMALAVAHVLGRPAPAAVAADAFIVPMTYFWTATLCALVAVLALVLAGWGMARLKTGIRSILDGRVVGAYPAAGLAAALAAPGDVALTPTRRRARRIAEEWSNAAITEVGQSMLGWFVIILAGLIGAAVVGYAADPNWVYSDLRWAVNIGDLIVGGFVLGLLYVGRQAYHNPQLRRTVGVLWDLGTFWPRATHPLAPPCYAERAVPDLVRRIHHLVGADGRVVLSCHSQGTVIGAAVVMQLTYAESARVALLTYGSPLRRLYARFFPAYFGVPALQRAGAFLVGEPIDTTDRARRSWPWRNLHRPSDPIGGPILVEYPATEISTADWAANERFGDNDDIDRQLIDPQFARTDGDIGDPPTHGHSGYADDRAYAATIAILRVLRLRPRAPTASESD